MLFLIVFIRFIALSKPVFILQTFHTVPYAPFPNFFIILYWSFGFLLLQFIINFVFIPKSFSLFFSISSFEPIIEKQGKVEDVGL